MTKLLRSSKQLDTFPSCQETPEFSGVSFFALEQNKSFRRAYLLDLPSFYQKVVGVDSINAVGNAPVTLQNKIKMDRGRELFRYCRTSVRQRHCLWEFISNIKEKR